MKPMQAIFHPLLTHTVLSDKQIERLKRAIGEDKPSGDTATVIISGDKMAEHLRSMFNAIK